jgi:hypothetical protein
VAHEAQLLLDEFRADPLGWSYLDVHRLLDLWGFAAEELEEGGKPLGIVWRYHREHLELDVVVHPRDPVHVRVALRAVEIVDSLRRLQHS